jgi:hypothetical protein
MLIAFADGIVQDDIAREKIEVFLQSCGIIDTLADMKNFEYLSKHMIKYEYPYGTMRMIPRDDKHFDLSDEWGPTEKQYYTVWVYDIPDFSHGLAKKLVAKLKVGNEYLDPQVFVESFGNWALVKDMEEAGDKYYFGENTTFIKDPKEIVVSNFQNNYITGSDPQIEKVNNEILELVKLVLDSESLPDRCRTETVQALTTVADQVKEKKVNSVISGGALTKIKEVVSKAADIAIPGLAIVEKVFKLLGLS